MKMLVTDNKLRLIGKPWQIRIMLQQAQKQWGPQITIKQLVTAMGQLSHE